MLDIGLRAGRLVEVTRRVRAQPDLAHLTIGSFGASTGDGVALVAAAEPARDWLGLHPAHVPNPMG